MGLSKLWAKGPDGSRGFVFSHVKTIYYNWAQKKLLSTKLDEIDALIDQKIAKAMMSNVQVNDQNKVPTSALAYAMQQQITENEEAITGLNSEQEKLDVDTMKTLSYNLQAFDFNDPTHLAGSYRIGKDDDVINPPGNSMYYGNVLVIRGGGGDTLAMLAFPFDDKGKFYYRQGSDKQWPTASWYYFQGTSVNES